MKAVAMWPVCERFKMFIQPIIANNKGILTQGVLLGQQVTDGVTAMPVGVINHMDGLYCFICSS